MAEKCGNSNSREKGGGRQQALFLRLFIGQDLLSGEKAASTYDMCVCACVCVCVCVCVCALCVCVLCVVCVCVCIHGDNLSDDEQKRGHR